MSSSQTDRALATESRFIAKVLEAYDNQQETWGLGMDWASAAPGDLIRFEEAYWDEDANQIPVPEAWLDGIPEGWEEAIVVANTPLLLRVRHPQTGVEVDLPLSDLYWSIVESSAVDALKHWALGTDRPEGVAYSDSAVSGRLWSDLRDEVNAIADEESVDYHPGSETRVRDLVHPSLYPYVEGHSLSAAAADGTSRDPQWDRFGRPYERSKFQWLPTPFTVRPDGSVSVDAYINNLDSSRYAAAYDGLARLFEAAVPLFESVLGYLNETTFWIDGVDDWSSDLNLADLNLKSNWLASRATPRGPVQSASLRGRTLQVIPKIVEYRIGRGESHEGVWHVEGMSHEHIVATCVYVLERDAALIGGDLQFRRMYTTEEADVLVMGLGQVNVPPALQTVLDTEGAPLGTVPMPEGRMIVFPNSHIHRLTELTLAPGVEEGKRRIIVFWLVDPDVRIHSTGDVSPQQELFTRDEALQYRLELMEERRLHKQTLNPRAINLCEH